MEEARLALVVRVQEMNMNDFEDECVDKLIAYQETKSIHKNKHAESRLDEILENASKQVAAWPAWMQRPEYRYQGGR